MKLSVEALNILSLITLTDTIQFKKLFDKSNYQYGRLTLPRLNYFKSKNGSFFKKKVKSRNVVIPTCFVWIDMLHLEYSKIFKMNVLFSLFSMNIFGSC